MNLRSRRLIVLPVAVICTALAACSTPTTQGFRRVENPQVDASYVAVGADFSKYDRIAAEEMGIFFPSHAAPSVEDQQRARKIFREAFLEQLVGTRGDQCPAVIRGVMVNPEIIRIVGISVPVPHDRIGGRVGG